MSSRLVDDEIDASLFGGAALISFAPGSDGAGCGHDRSYQWPAILNDQDQPTQTVDDNIAFQHAGGTSRLVKYKGITYFDTRTDNPMDGLPSHEVWKLNAGAATQMCGFIPDAARLKRCAPRKGWAAPRVNSD